jgi:hypothetical protein
MAPFVALHSRLYYAHLNLTSLTESIDFGPLQIAEVDFTNFGSGGHAEFKPGLASGDYSLGLFQDRAAGALDDQLTLSTISNQYPISVVPNADGGDSVGDPCHLSRGIIGAYSPLAVVVGAADKASIKGKFDTTIASGLVAHPVAARTATGTGTAVALAGPSAAQKLYATLHVVAFTGLTNVVFKVQADNASNFPSATDRITFSTVTGVGSQFASVAGDFSIETHQRLSWTVTGTGSITFFAAVGVV